MPFSMSTVAEIDARLAEIKAEVAMLKSVRRALGRVPKSTPLFDKLAHDATPGAEQAAAPQPEATFDPMPAPDVPAEVLEKLDEAEVIGPASRPRGRKGA
jgi:hypothetical protein